MKFKLLATMALGVCGCVVTDVGNPQTDPPAEAEVRLEAFEEGDPRALTLSSGLTITHAWIAADEARLSPCEQVESEDEELEEEDELRSDEPVVTDLLTGTSWPGAFALSAPGTSYCGVELDLRPLALDELPGGAPADLADYTVIVRGVRKDGNPWIVRARFEDSLELDGDVELRRDELNELVIGFAVNGWITSRDLDLLPGSPVIIDEETTPELHDRFVEALLASPRLFVGEVGGAVLAQ